MLPVIETSSFTATAKDQFGNAMDHNRASPDGGGVERSAAAGFLPLAARQAARTRLGSERCLAERPAYGHQT